MASVGDTITIQNFKSHQFFDTSGNLLPKTENARLDEYLVQAIRGDITANTIAFVDSDPDTITDSGSGFVTAGFVAGDEITVTGSASNDGTYTIDTVTAGTITLLPGESLTAEGAGASITIKGPIDRTSRIVGSISVGTVEVTNDTGNPLPVSANTTVNSSSNPLYVSDVGTVGAPLPQAVGTDAVGTDAYATIVTPTADATQLHVTLQGSNDAIISLDGGTTDHFYIAAQSTSTFDNVKIQNAVDIQAKNAVGGSNYANLAITIW